MDLRKAFPTCQLWKTLDFTDNMYQWGRRRVFPVCCFSVTHCRQIKWKSICLHTHCVFRPIHIDWKCFHFKTHEDYSLWTVGQIFARHYFFTYLLALSWGGYLLFEELTHSHAHHLPFWWWGHFLYLNILGKITF